MKESPRKSDAQSYSSIPMDVIKQNYKLTLYIKSSVSPGFIRPKIYIVCYPKSCVQVHLLQYGLVCLARTKESFQQKVLVFSQKKLSTFKCNHCFSFFVHLRIYTTSHPHFIFLGSFKQPWSCSMWKYKSAILLLRTVFVLHILGINIQEHSCFVFLFVALRWIK